MINPRLALQVGTLAYPGQDTLSPQALAAGTPGVPEIPSGTVTSEQVTPSIEQKTIGQEHRQVLDEEDEAYARRSDARRNKTNTAVKEEGQEAESAQAAVANAKSIEEQREALRSAERERKAQEIAARTKALDELERVSTVSSAFEDAMPLRKLLSAIAIGGGAYAASRTGGPNQAWEIYKAKADEHRRVQEAAIKNDTERVMMQTKNAEEAHNYFIKAMEDLDKKETAKAKIVTLELDALKKANPKVADAADEAKAQADMDYAHQRSQLLTGYDTTERREGTKVQTSEGSRYEKGDKDGPKKSEAEQKMAMLGSSMRAELNVIEKFPALSQETLENLQDDELEAAAADEKAKSGPMAAKLVKFMRGTGFTARNKYDSLDPEEKKVANAWDNATEKYTRLLTGAGMPADEARRMALQNSPVVGDDEEQQKFKFNRLAREADFMMALSYDARKAIVARIQQGESIDYLIEAQQKAAQESDAVEYKDEPPPKRARTAKSAKQDAAASTSDDYGAIREAASTGRIKLTPAEQADMKDALQALKKNQTDADAARFLSQFRQRKGI